MTHSPIAASIRLALCLSAAAVFAPAFGFSSEFPVGVPAYAERLSALERDSLAAAKVARDLRLVRYPRRRMQADCGRFSPTVSELQTAMAERGEAERAIALVYTRAPFAAVRALGLAGPAISLGEAWRSVAADAIGKSAFLDWSDADYEAALASLSARLCKPVADKR